MWRKGPNFYTQKLCESREESEWNKRKNREFKKAEAKREEIKDMGNILLNRCHLGSGYVYLFSKTEDRSTPMVTKHNLGYFSSNAGDRFWKDKWNPEAIMYESVYENTDGSSLIAFVLSFASKSHTSSLLLFVINSRFALHAFFNVTKNNRDTFRNITIIIIIIIIFWF